MPRPATPIGQLTRREEDVARLMARGFTNPQIAEELGISFATAKWYVSQVIAKLDAGSREEAAAIWKAEQGLPRRLSRFIGGLSMSAAWRYASGGVAAAALVIVGALILFTVFSNGDDGGASPGPTPTTSASPTPTTPAVASPCDEENLVNGFLVIGAGEPVPECAGLDQATPITGDSRRYALEVSPGPWNQQDFEPATLADGTRLDGIRYLNNETGSVALAVYRHLWAGLPGRVIRGIDPQPVNYLPGPGVVVQRDGSTAAYWTEDDQTFGIELFEAGDSNLTIEQAAGLVVYFDAAANEARFWSPSAGAFTDRPAWFYPDDVDTGFDYINEIVQTFLPGEQSLEPFGDFVMAPCVASPAPGIQTEPACPPGTADGALVPALLFGGCPGDIVAIDAGNSGLLQSGAVQRVWLYAISRFTEASDIQGLEYVAAFTTGERVTWLAITDSGVAGIGGSGCPTPELANWARTVDEWLLPPRYPLPGPQFHTPVDPGNP